MIKLRVPATSANLGPGFDCLGLALGIYDIFTVEPSASLQISGIDPQYQGEDNLFVQAYRQAGECIGIRDQVTVAFQTDIPISRGLGSSAALIAAGAAAGSLLHGNALRKAQLLEIAARLEGHPDNAAPCLYGGLTAALMQDGSCYCQTLPLSPRFRFTVLIPDCEVSTRKARAILPNTYPRAVAASNAAHAILLCQALASGDLSLLKAAARDQLHEPYRKKLIPGFDEIKAICEQSTGGVLLISGSGSTCLLISFDPLPKTAVQEIVSRHQPTWQIRTPAPAYQGIQQMGENGQWQTII